MDNIRDTTHAPQYLHSIICTATNLAHLQNDRQQLLSTVDAGASPFIHSIDLYLTSLLTRCANSTVWMGADA